MFFGALTSVGALFSLKGENWKMNEKELIKGEFSISGELSLLCFLLAGTSFLLCFLVATIIGGNPMWAFEGMKYGYYWFFIVMAVAIGFGVAFMKMKFELIVTEGKVVGKTLFGKRVDLPISQISATGTGIFSRVSISTAAGSINFYGVRNKEEVLSVISDLLLKRQEETKTTTIQSSGNINTVEELKKYKDLLDAGVITQEEFDAKKKQLLGL